MSSFRSASILLLLLLSLLLGVTGCGGGDAAPPTAQATTAPTAPLAPTAPPVTPAPTLTPAPLMWPLKCTPPTASAFPAGDYYVIDATGQFFDTSGTPWGPTTYYADGRVNRTGTLGCFTLAQHQITFTETSTGSPLGKCPKAQPTGVYTWAFDGKILSFTLVNDPCSARSQFFTTYRWEMQP